MANGEEFSQIMADNQQKRPSKGILKTSSSFDKQDKTSKKPAATCSQKATKWDEMNIIATLHPADKDYGHMKIEEPKTPYNWDIGEEDEVDGQGQSLDPDVLAAKLQSEESPRRKSFPSESDDEDSDVELTPEEVARRKDFKSKRKMHYNEYKVVEYARKLIKADEDELDSDENEAGEGRSSAGSEGGSRDGPQAAAESSSSAACGP